MAKKKKSKAGRKPVDDPKVQISFYPLQSVVKDLGKEECQEIALNAVNKEHKKLKK